MHVQPKKTALVGAVMLGGWHVVWSLFVLLGWSQSLINFSMWAHMVQFSVTFGRFDALAALTVITVAALLGYGVGFVFGIVWNKVHRV